MARKIKSIDAGLFASPDYLKRKGPKVLEDLAQHACIGFYSQLGRAKWNLVDPDGREDSAAG